MGVLNSGVDNEKITAWCFAPCWCLRESGYIFRKRTGSKKSPIDFPVIPQNEAATDFRLVH